MRSVSHEEFKEKLIKDLITNIRKYSGIVMQVRKTDL